MKHGVLRPDEGGWQASRYAARAGYRVLAGDRRPEAARQALRLATHPNVHERNGTRARELALQAAVAAGDAESERERPRQSNHV